MSGIGSNDIKDLLCVGPKRAALLNKELSIYTIHDLLYYFPSKYVDRSQIYTISGIDIGMSALQLKGSIIGFDSVGEGARRRFIAHFSDGTGVIDLVWFQGIKYVETRYKLNCVYLIYGKPSLFNGRINIIHPDIEIYTESSASLVGLRPSYNTTDRMKRSFLNSHAMEKIMNIAIRLFADHLSETLPSYIIEENHLMSLCDALRNIHFPPARETLRKAQYRLKFEELFYIQLDILRYANDRRQKYRGVIFSKIGTLFNTFYYDHLPFRLTDSQKRVMKEIRVDMGGGRQMNRLLQGDVGSGKTLVALMSMLIALDNGYQACLMAPTEILANQHYATICNMLEGLNIRIELLTGSIKGKKRASVLAGLKSGETKIIIGTHALIENTVIFNALGIVVIDEQHRFGVAQRASMWGKNKLCPPHMLVMTATPIPRTLAMTLYGDLDISVIDELPPGRKPITTMHMYDSHKKEIYRFIRDEIKKGRQAYIVYPLIKESEKIDLENLEAGYTEICNAFSNCVVCKVHGQMKSFEKDEQMHRFTTGEAQILVATTVIEVGVNVPNATVMVIENAERFGLSQLHQLRGRVGRGGDQSYCVLVSSYKISKDTRKRIQIMVDTNDGFEIAEADLKLRGPGDLEGTQQSGMPFELKIANVITDAQLLQYAREKAQNVLKKDPMYSLPENNILWEQLRLLHATEVNWSDIG